MTVQYGEDTGATSGYSSSFDTSNLHPAMQNHLNNLQQVSDKVSTPYAAKAFSDSNPAPQPAQQISPIGPVGQNAQTNAPAPSAPNQALPDAPGQLPNQTSLAGTSAGGGADTANTATAGQEPKPNPVPLGGLGNPIPGPSPIDNSDTDNIGKVADQNINQLAAQYKQMQAAQHPAQGMQPNGTGTTSGGMQLNNNMNVPGLDGEQVNNARAIIQAGLQRGLSRENITAAIMAGLTESSLRNLTGGDRDSAGLFQMRPSQGWGTYQQVTDPNYEINKFYDTMAGLGNTSGMTPWQVDQAIERSAYSDGSNYQANYDLAQRAVDALVQQQPQGQVAAPTMASNGSLNWISQNTNKYLDFDGWYGAQCVDLYDFYSTGFVGASPNPVGYAQEIWTNHDYNAYAQIDASQPTQMGDVAVWGQGPYTPMSHVGIVIADNGDGTLKTLSNNATSAGSSGNSAVVNISKTALLGYLRPRRLMG